MRGHHDCHPTAMQPYQKPLDFIGDGRIQVSGRLVRQNYPGVVDYGAGNDHTLLLTAAQLMRILPALVGQTDAREDMQDFAFDRFATMTGHVLGKRNIVEDVTVRKQLEVLEYNTQ